MLRMGSLVCKLEILRAEEGKGRQERRVRAEEGGAHKREAVSTEGRIRHWHARALTMRAKAVG